jgi:hypothetical protein
MDGVRWGFALMLAGGVIVAYLFDQVPFVAVAMERVALVALLVTAHADPWWMRPAVVGVLAGVFVETARAVVGTSAFDPAYAVVLAVVVTLYLALFERASADAEPS